MSETTGENRTTGSAAPDAEARPAEDAGTRAESGPKVVSDQTVDAVGDLVQMFVDYVRQQADDIMQSKIVQPAQKLGISISSITAAGCLFVLGLLWLSVGAFVALGLWLGWAIACVIVGGLLILIALVLYAISRRNRQ